MNSLKSILVSLVIILGLIIFGCSKSATTTRGTGGTTAVFTLGGSPGSCTGFTLGSGAYVSGTALTSNNTVTISVTVTTAGDYSITTPTANGIKFTAAGTFSSTGPQTVTLTGSGTPTAASASNYSVTVGSSTCTFIITPLSGSSTAIFTLGGSGGNCTGFTLGSGAYVVGTALTATNTVSLTVNVTTAGTYSITTPTVNGISFSKTSAFTSTGAQTVILTGTGTPMAASASIYTVTAGGGNCTFTVTPTAPVVTSWQFNACDVLDAQWEISGGETKLVQTTNPTPKEGAGWIEADMASTDGLDYLHFIDRRPTPLSTPLDSTNSQLHFWFYVSDISQMRLSSVGKDAGQVEITSSGMSDFNEYDWSTDSLISSWHNGWNEVTLNLLHATQAGGVPDLTHLNLFRIYFWLNSTTHPDLRFGVDDISIRKKP